MGPPNAERRPPTRDAASRKIIPTKDHPHHDGTALPRVPARFYGPNGRRGLGLLLVTRCPFGCGGVHVHRGVGGVRRAGCGAGEYVVVAAGRAA
jgi:hypothetical protein